MAKTAEEIAADETAAAEKVAADAAAKAAVDAKAAEEAGTTYEVKVGGETKNMTMGELVAAASKVEGADARFEEAAQIRKDSEAASNFFELVNSIKNSETGATKDQYLQMFRDAGFVDSDIPDYDEVIKTKGSAKVAKEDKNAEEVNKKVTLENMDDETKAILEAAKEANYSKVREEIYNKVEKSVDKDEILAKLIDSKTDADRTKVRSTLCDMTKSEVQRRILANEPFSDEMVQSVLQGIRHQVESLGIPAKAITQIPVVGFGPTPESSAKIIADKPIERVSSDDPDYIDNVVERHLQKQYKSDYKKA